MLSDLPWSIVIAYAFFRVFEYIALKNYQYLPKTEETRGAQLIFGAVLLPSRILGWGLLLLLVFKIGLLPTIAVVVIAFLLSLPLQTLLTLASTALAQYSGVVVLAAVPIIGVYILFAIMRI